MIFFASASPTVGQRLQFRQARVVEVDLLHGLGRRASSVGLVPCSTGSPAGASRSAGVRLRRGRLRGVEHGAVVGRQPGWRRASRCRGGAWSAALSLRLPRHQPVQRNESATDLYINSALSFDVSAMYQADAALRRAYNRLDLARQTKNPAVLPLPGLMWQRPEKLRPLVASLTATLLARAPP